MDIYLKGLTPLSRLSSGMYNAGKRALDNKKQRCCRKALNCVILNDTSSDNIVSELGKFEWYGTTVFSYQNRETKTENKTLFRMETLNETKNL